MIWPGSVFTCAVAASASAIAFRPRQLRQAKIQNLHAFVVGEKQVFRLQVAMDDSLFVRRRQSPRHLQRVFNRLATG